MELIGKETMDIREIGNEQNLEISDSAKKIFDRLMGDDLLPDNLLRQEENDSEMEMRIYLDDNGKSYRVGDDLIPNNEYNMNTYHYYTDYNGRISTVEGFLHMKNREGRLDIVDSIETIGKGYELTTDDRGHLIGDQFDGSNGMENLVPQDAKINRNDFKLFEIQLANEVKQGNYVFVRIEPIYEGVSRRPEALVVDYSINGKEDMRIFPNREEGIK